MVKNNNSNKKTRLREPYNIEDYSHIKSHKYKYKHSHIQTLTHNSIFKTYTVLLLFNKYKIYILSGATN